MFEYKHNENIWKFDIKYTHLNNDYIDIILPEKLNNTVFVELTQIYQIINDKIDCTNSNNIPLRVKNYIEKVFNNRAFI